jgi:hypothetical protein
MDRLRSKWCSYLALLALTLQLVLSFGHVHVGPISHDSAAKAVATTSDAAKPAGRHHDHLPGHADNYCAICALIHLAGTALPSASPALPVPAVSARSPHQIIVQFDLTAPPGALFQARAPPIA